MNTGELAHDHDDIIIAASVVDAIVQGDQTRAEYLLSADATAVLTGLIAMWLSHVTAAARMLSVPPSALTEQMHRDAVRHAAECTVNPS